MNTDNMLTRIPSRYWGYLALLLWGSAALFLSRQDAYNLDEGAAKSLLLVWSIADQIASSVVTFGAPDLRTLLFIPVGFLWTGNIFAAKVFTVLSFAFATWLLFSWKRSSANAECALLASGLLLISPLPLEQIDTLSPGVYLILAFALGAWLDKAYRAQPYPFGGWYFSQLIVSALSTSLHPAGLAYPLALLWSWHKEPLDHKQQRYFYIGVGFVTVFTLLVRMGWHDLEWLQNPIRSLAAIALGSLPGDEMTAVRWATGIVILAPLAITLFKQYRNLWSDFTGRILMIGLALGASVGDQTWGLIALCIVLYFGFPLLLRPTQSPVGGFMHQRGAALLLIVILSTVFMQADKAHYEIRQHGILSAQDQLIQVIADEAESARKAAEENEGVKRERLRIASQWPSRTMIACKCDTLPLPPAAKDPPAQLAMLHSITHLLFNPQQPANMLLARNLAVLGGTTETIALQDGGVLLRLKSQDETTVQKDK